MSIKPTDNQKSVMNTIKEAMKSGNYTKLAYEFVHVDDKTKLANNRDTFAGIAFHVQKIFKKGGDKWVSEYFNYWLYQAARNIKKGDFENADWAKEYQVKLALVRQASIIACCYDPVTDSKVVAKNSHTREEIKTGRASNLKDMGIGKWFLPRANRPLGNSVQITPEDCE